MHLTYKFEHDDRLNITIQSDSDVNFVMEKLNMQWRITIPNTGHPNITILEKTTSLIKYSITKTNKKYGVFLLDKYVTLMGCSLYMPNVDYKLDLDIKFESNFPLLISRFGLIVPNRIYQFNRTTLCQSMFVLTNNYVVEDYISYAAQTITDLDLIPRFRIKKFMDSAYNFFGITDQIQHVISFINTESNYIPGRGVRGGMYYSNTTISPFVIYHELFHHFNGRSSIKWFAEGFDEFFCRYLCLGANEFTEQKKLFYDNYMKNPYKNIPSDVTIPVDANSITLSYEKGFVLACFWLGKYGDKFIVNYKTVIKELYSKWPSRITSEKSLQVHLEINPDDFDQYVYDGKTIELLE